MLKYGANVQRNFEEVILLQKYHASFHFNKDSVWKTAVSVEMNLTHLLFLVYWSVLWKRCLCYENTSLAQLLIWLLLIHMYLKNTHVFVGGMFLLFNGTARNNYIKLLRNFNLNMSITTLLKFVILSCLILLLPLKSAIMEISRCGKN